MKHKDIINMSLINNSSSISDKEKLRKDHQVNSNFYIIPLVIGHQ